MCNYSGGGEGGAIHYRMFSTLGGYHEYSGGCSVQWIYHDPHRSFEYGAEYPLQWRVITSTVGDIMSTVEDVQ